MIIRTSNNRTLLQFLFNSYGNVSTLMAVSDLLFKGSGKNKYVRYVKKTIPMGIFSYDLYNKIKIYIRR